MLPLNEFNKGKSNLNSIERKNELNKIAKNFDVNVIKLVDYEIVNFDNDIGGLSILWLLKLHQSL